jgi:hypothetical protein
MIDGRFESSEIGFGLETDEAKGELAKFGRPFVGFGYVRVDSKFWSAEDRFQICCGVQISCWFENSAVCAFRGMFDQVWGPSLARPVGGR